MILTETKLIDGIIAVFTDEEGKRTTYEAEGMYDLRALVVGEVDDYMDSMNINPHEITEKQLNTHVNKYSSLLDIEKLSDWKCRDGGEFFVVMNKKG